MFKELMDKIYSRFKDEETMHEVIGLTAEVMEAIRLDSPEGYKKMVSALECYLYDISLDEAKEIVSHMSNEYGAQGGRWSYEDVCDVATQYQIPESIDRIQLYIVMNMWASDYVRTMKHLGMEDKIDAYLMFSCDWLTDSDFGKGKVYKYFIKLHEDE